MPKDENTILQLQRNQITIPDNVLNWLQETKCTNNKTYIEDAKAKPLKWLQNKQLARELMTHEKIRGDFTITEAEKQTHKLFIDENNVPLTLAKNKTVLSTDSDNLCKFLATL